MTLRNTGLRICIVGLALAFGIVMARGARANEDMETKFKSMDTNGDGKISADEQSAYATTKFEKIDANGDGKVTVTEMETAHEKMMGKGKSEKMTVSTTEKVKMMDTNGDGVVSAEEFTASSKTMFDKADANGDGYLTKTEMKTGMEKMKAEKEKPSVK